MEPIVSFTDVAFRYRGGARRALDGFSFGIVPGETVIVLGKSGAGKSTLCCCLNGLVPNFLKGEFSGRVTVAGRNTLEHAVKSFAPTVGMVFQDFESQLFSTTAELEAAFGPENLALPREEIRRRVTAALSRTGLSGYEKREPATLSGGEKQRLALAATLSLHPAVLALDEPTSDLDPRGKEEVHSIARALRQERLCAVVLVEPETEEAHHADRVVVLRDGRVDLSGPPSRVLRETDRLRAAGVRPSPSAELSVRLGLPPVVEPQEAALAIRSAGYKARGGREAAAASRGGPSVLSARKLGFSYAGSSPVVDGIDLDIFPGDLVAILGQNGSGKTTLAKLLAGILSPSAGVVLSAGADIRRLSRLEASRRVGFVFQNPDHQIFAETVEDEVSFGPRHHGLSEREVSSRVEEALSAVALLDRRRSDPFLLSKGERQRVAVASVLATRPETIILDEPTTGLDYGEIRDAMSLVGRLNASGHAVVMITHAMWVAAEYARRIVVMEKGRILADGSPQEVFRRRDVLRRAALKPPETAVLADLLGLDALSVDGMASALEVR
jgi:energy-coupling factor transport system ATP-binding protein